MTTVDAERTLSEILDGLSYPAEKWQITACAEIYGADVHTRRVLYDLPAQTYESVEHITTTMSVPS
jgi:hypothetical protein